MEEVLVTVITLDFFSGSISLCYMASPCWPVFNAVLPLFKCKGLSLHERRLELWQSRISTLADSHSNFTERV
jgi:hypothetical protein